MPKPEARGIKGSIFQQQSELSAAQLDLVRGCAERSDSEFTVEMYPLVLAFDRKNATFWQKNNAPSSEAVCTS